MEKSISEIQLAKASHINTENILQFEKSFLGFKFLTENSEGQKKKPSVSSNMLSKLERCSFRNMLHVLVTKTAVTHKSAQSQNDVLSATLTLNLEDYTVLLQKGETFINNIWQKCDFISVCYRMDFISDSNNYCLTTQLMPNLWPWNSATCVFSATSQTLTAG